MALTLCFVSYSYKMSVMCRDYATETAIVLLSRLLCGFWLFIHIHIYIHFVNANISYNSGIGYHLCPISGDGIIMLF